MRQEVEVVNRDHLRCPARGNEQRMRRVRHVHGAGERFDRRPLRPVPQVVQHPHRHTAIDHPAVQRCADSRIGAVLPRAGEDRQLVAVRLLIRADQRMEVLADAGPLAQGRPVVDEDSHVVPV
jgi:hypothetical protein